MFPELPTVQCLFQCRTQAVCTLSNNDYITIHKNDTYFGGNISFATNDAKERVLAQRHALHAFVKYPICELSQVHGDAIVFDPTATLAEGLPIHEADGQATNKAGCALMIKTADCQPILFAHEGGKHIMALHVGWRGNRIGFIATAIKRFCKQYALRPQELMAVRGPSLGPAAAEFVNFSQEWGQSFAPWFTESTRTMDLWALTRHQLQEAGLMPSRIFGLDMCTKTMHQQFFSHRYEKKSGRQASLIYFT